MPNFDRLREERPFVGWEEPIALESLAVARETVHSAMLAWLLRTSDLPLGARSKILESLSGELPWAPTRITTETEWKKLDVLIRVGGDEVAPSLVALENKLKASEHDAQLEPYDRDLENSGDPVIAKVFLTLVGDKPTSGSGWRAASYADLAGGLEKAARISENRYLTDYRELVQRLVAADRLASNCPPYAAYVFHDPLSSADIVPGFKDYVQQCRLYATLQRSWFGEIVRCLDSAAQGWMVKIAETHGAALIDFARVARRGSVKVKYGLQLQNWQLKAFAVRNSDGDRITVEQVFEEIRNAVDVSPAAKLTADRGRGFRSFSLNIKRSRDERYDQSVWARDIAKTLRLLEPLGEMESVRS